MALNDPQWGNKKNGGPPDLEEMLRKFNRKLAALLGGKGGGTPGGGGSGGAPRGVAGSVGIIVVIVALVWVGSGFYIVDPSQRGVVLRFGKFTEVTQPGPHWHMPFPLESVDVVNMGQVRTVAIGYRDDNPKNKRLQESLMLTDDLNIIDIQFAVQYVLKDPTDYVFNNRMNEEGEFVRQVAESAIRETVGKNKMDFVLYEGRDQVQADTTKLIQDMLDRYKSGILISKVTMQQTQPPEQVQASFDDAVKAGQDRERQKSEGQAYANNVVPRAKGEAARLSQQAQGYKQRVIASAEGDASRFRQILVEYTKAPQVTRERMYLDMMQQILSSTTKILVEQKGGNSMLYLPLDKIIQGAYPGAAPLPELSPAKPADQAAQQPAAEAGGRDMSLGRERRERP